MYEIYAKRAKRQELQYILFFYIIWYNSFVLIIIKWIKTLLQKIDR